MKFGYTIVYVPNVEASLNFYKEAFGFETKLLHESKDYGELETGDTVLAFASHELGDANIGGHYVKSDSVPLGIELVFVTNDVQTAFDKAVNAGADSLKVPEVKPWGQTVAYVKTPDSSLIELCTPVS